MAGRAASSLGGRAAGLFAVPYLTFYSLLIPFALVISVALWVICGGLIGRCFLSRP